jgi:hypothetical protein
MVPAKERLEPRQASVGEMHDRLVVDLESAVLDRFAQVRLQLEQRERPRVHGRVEHRVAQLFTPAASLGPKYRAICAEKDTSIQHRSHLAAISPRTLPLQEAVVLPEHHASTALSADARQHYVIVER